MSCISIFQVLNLQRNVVNQLDTPESPININLLGFWPCFEEDCQLLTRQKAQD
jgi:hypothetical protein